MIKVVHKMNQHSQRYPLTQIFLRPAERGRKNLGLKAFTLIEILVSLFLLALTFAGMANLFLAGKGILRHTLYRVTAAELGKAFLDSLQLEVRQDTWNQVGNTLYLPIGEESRTYIGTESDSRIINGIKFTPSYTISRVRDAAGRDTQLRRVQLSISWPEPRH